MLNKDFHQCCCSKVRSFIPQSYSNVTPGTQNHEKKNSKAGFIKTNPPVAKTIIFILFPYLLIVLELIFAV